MPTFVSSPLRSPDAAREAGFTLIEVLVAILVLSFGMLGVVGLQMSAMQANKEAKNQSSGVRYARELAESMRANFTVLPQPTSGNAYFPVDIQDATGAGVPAAFTCAANSASAPVCASHFDLSKQDMRDWYLRARNELPGLRLVVCQDSNPYDASGAAQWGCTPPVATSAGQSIFIKLGWTQQTTNRAATGQPGSDLIKLARDGIPLVVIPVDN